MRALVDPKRLPAVVRRTLAAQCDHEWDRVTTDDGNGYIVHNNAFKAAAYVESGSIAATFTVPAATTARFSQAPPAAKKVRSAEVRALAEVFKNKGNNRITPGVNVVSAGRAPRVNEHQVSHEIEPSEVDWDKLSDDQLDATAHGLLQRCLNGLPEHIPFVFHPEVMALYGFSDVEDELRAVLRQPTRVEIRPETGTKHYPILGFWRGDLNVILGMRNPATPAVIAAYFQSLLEHDTHRVNSHGGGGAKKSSDDGVPSTPQAVIRRLRGLGAEITFAQQRDATGTATVTFDGQVLGSITAGRSNRATSQNDWQRMQRKIEAINRRKQAAS